MAINRFHFFAYMARMKLINRWSLRRNTRPENDQEHSLQVAMIAHALATIENVRYNGAFDVDKIVTLAVFHEAPEVITGDLPSPIKYFNPDIRAAYKSIEKIAAKKLLGYLPDDLRDAYKEILIADEESDEWRVVKAADKISAYLKCVEENSFGNAEFTKAQTSILHEITAMNLCSVGDFMKDFAPSFALSLDGLN